MPSRKKPKKPSKPAKPGRPLTISDLAGPALPKVPKPKPTARAQAVIDDPALDTEGFSPRERLAVVLGLARRIWEDGEGELFDAYHAHFADWRAVASDKEFNTAQVDIFDNVDEGYLANPDRFLAVIPFLFEDDPDVVREAAKLVCIHHPVVDGDRLHGARSVLVTLEGRYDDGVPEDDAVADRLACAVAHGVAGVLSCGDPRLMPLLVATWKKLPPAARLHLALCREVMPSELEAAFWLERAAEAVPASPDFKLAIEHLMEMADTDGRFALFAGSFKRHVFNFGLEKGTDEYRKSTDVPYAAFLNANAATVRRILGFPKNRPFFDRLLTAWNCRVA